MDAQLELAVRDAKIIQLQDALVALAREKDPQWLQQATSTCFDQARLPAVLVGVERQLKEIQLRNLQQQATLQQDELLDMRKRLQATKDEHDALEATHATELETLRTTLTAEREALLDIHAAELREAEEKVQRAAVMDDVVHAINAKQHEGIQIYKEDGRKFMAGKKELKTRIQELEGLLKTEVAAKQALAAQNATLQESNQTLAAQDKLLVTREEQLSAQTVTLQARVRELERQSADNDDRVAQADAALTAQKTACSTLHARVAELELERNDGLVRERKRLAEYDDVRRALPALLDERRVLADELARMRRQLDGLPTLSAVTQERDDAVAALHSVRASHKEQNQEAARAALTANTEDEDTADNRTSSTIATVSRCSATTDLPDSQPVAALAATVHQLEAARAKLRELFQERHELLLLKKHALMRGEMPEEHNAALKRQRVLRDEACARVFALEKERDDALAALRGGDDAQNDASIERRDDDAKLRRVEAHVVKALCMEVVARGSVIETLKAAHAEKPIRADYRASPTPTEALPDPALRQQLKNAREKFDHLSQEYNELAGINMSLRGEVRDLSNAHDEVLGQRDDARAQVASVVTECEYSRAQAVKLGRERDAVRAQLAALNKDSEATLAEAIAREHTTLLAERDEARAQADMLGSECDAAVNALDERDDTVKKLNETIDQLRARVFNQSVELQNLQPARERLAHLEPYETEVLVLRERVQMSEGFKENLFAEVLRQERSARTLLAAAKETCAESDTLVSVRSTLEAQLKILEALGKQFSAADCKATLLDWPLSAMVPEVDAVRCAAKLAETEQMLREWKLEVQALKRKHKTDLAEAMKEHRKMLDVLKHEKYRSATLASLRDELVNGVEANKVQVRRLQAKIKDLERDNVELKRAERHGHTTSLSDRAPGRILGQAAQDLAARLKRLDMCMIDPRVQASKSVSSPRRLVRIKRPSTTTGGPTAPPPVSGVKRAHEALSEAGSDRRKKRQKRLSPRPNTPGSAASEKVSSTAMRQEITSARLTARVTQPDHRAKER